MPKFRRGTYKVTCDLTGGTFRADGCRTQWDNSFVNIDDLRPFHPQDRVMVPKEIAYPPIARSHDNMALPYNVDFGYDFSNDFNGLVYRL